MVDVIISGDICTLLYIQQFHLITQVYVICFTNAGIADLVIFRKTAYEQFVFCLLYPLVVNWDVKLGEFLVPFQNSITIMPMFDF